MLDERVEDILLELELLLDAGESICKRASRRTRHLGSSVGGVQLLEVGQADKTGI